MPEVRRTYPISTGYWVEEGALTVRDTDGGFVASIPIGFMDGSGDRNWTFVEKVLKDCLSCPGTLRTAAGDAVDINITPMPGEYCFVRSDHPERPLSFRKGPQSNRRGRPPIPGASASTVSDSKRSTPQQNSFRTALIARDGDCLLTGESYEGCTAAHIIPFSRADVYEAILGYPEQYLYHTWMGLLLEDKLHHYHDRLDWALWPREDDYVIHYFDHSKGNYKGLHGLVIPLHRFRGRPYLRPRLDLLKWHHRRCVQAHFRGFSYEVGAADAVQESVADL
ncbi:MAG: hypothetical protein CYPHOPRED_001862 [Cyphobasidiales sp. Tagirdzhanova-0007]|nr:MAG: hypothetical protein CYPHOPRED_001862 [Cyphobasidiales sp. Tagirdzhanova-0007]